MQQAKPQCQNLRTRGRCSNYALRAALLALTPTPPLLPESAVTDEAERPDQRFPPVPAAHGGEEDTGGSGRSHGSPGRCFVLAVGSPAPSQALPGPGGWGVGGR